MPFKCEWVNVSPINCYAGDNSTLRYDCDEPHLRTRSDIKTISPDLSLFKMVYIVRNDFQVLKLVI